MATKKEHWRTMSDDEYYQRLSAMMGFPESERLPEMFRIVLPPIEAQMIVHMPATEEDLMQKMNLDRETVDKHIKHLYEGGVCNPGRVGWRMIPAYGLLKDAISPSWKYDWERPFGPGGLFGKGSLGEQFEKKEWFPRTVEEARERDEAAGGPGSRVIPNYKAIDGIPGVEWYDDMRQILKKVDEESEDGIAMGRCACRWIHGEVDLPLWVCLNFGRFARYNIKRGAFWRITLEEALKICDMAMDAGLVFKQTPNCRAVERQICLCGGDGCPTYSYTQIYREPISHKRMAPSRFVPVVDPKKCKACGKCVEQCLHGAALLHFYEDIGQYRSWTDLDKCKGVGTCVVKCPNGARTMKLVKPPEYIPEWADIGKPLPSKAAK